MDDRELEKLMSASAVRQVQLLNDSLPSDAELNEITPSEEFQQYMRTAITKDQKRQKKLQSRKRLRKMAACFAIVVAVSFGVIMSVDATRANFFQLFEKSFSISSQHSEGWDKEFNAQIATNCHHVYLPSWMIEGFKATQLSQGIQGCTITYKDGDKTVRLIQNDNYGNALNDSETKTMEKIILEKQIYYYSEKDRSGAVSRKLTWTTDNNNFTLDATISRAELLKIAQSLVLKES